MNGNSSVSLGEGNPDSESYDKSGQTILEEISLSSNDINDQDVIDYAKTIGINPSTEPFLLSIARKGLLAPLPLPWIPVQDQLGRIYFHNKVTGISTWTHPVDRFLQSFVKKKRSEKRKSLMAVSDRLNPLVNLRFLDVADDEEDEDDNKGNQSGLRLTSNRSKSIGHSRREDDVKLGQPLISGGKINQRNDDLMSKGKNNVTNSTDIVVDQRLTLSSLDESIEDEIDSIQFELDDDAFKEMEDDGSLEEDIVTLDLTEGGPCDVKNYHEIYQIDLLTIDSIDNRKKDEIDEEQRKKVKIERPKSGRPGSRNIKPSLEIDDDLDNYIDGDEDGDDDFSLKSLENDPFAGEGVGMFQVTRQELITLPSFPLTQLETLAEEPDEDEEVKVSVDEDETEFEEDDDESMNDGKQIENDGVDRQKPELIDLIGQQANFRKMSDQLRKEITKLRDELFTVINRKSDDFAKKTIERLDGVERRLSESEKTIHSIQSDQRKNQMESNLITTVNHDGPYCRTEIAKIRQEVDLVNGKTDQVLDGCKQLIHEESDLIKKNMNDMRGEFEMTMEQFRDFKKDNELTIKALRKQLTEVSTSQDNLESLTSKTQSDLHRLSREVNSIRQDDDEDQDNLRSEIKHMMMKERIEKDKLSQSIDEIRDLVRKEINSMEKSLKKHDEQFTENQATINDDMNQTKSVLHYLTKELETIKQSVEEGKNNEIKESEIASSNAALEEKLNQLEANLTAINGKLEAIRVSRERERKMRMRSTNYNSNRSRKYFSSCSSYEDSLSSSEEEIEKNRDKSHLKSRNKHFQHLHHPHHHNQPHTGNSSQQQSKVAFDSGLNRHRDYIKYSPLHFSPILITSQPMEKPHRLKSSSSSLLAMIRRTSRLLQDEASDLDGLGNYRFVSDISNGLMSRNDLDADEGAIRKLKQIRGDIDEKLKRINAMVNSSNAEDANISTAKS